MTRTLILGAGVAGLTAAHALSGRGDSVTIIDSFAHIGGSHRSFQIDGMTFDIGSIFFWKQYKLFEMFPACREACVLTRYATQRLNPAGEVSEYPFALSEVLWQSPLGLGRSALDYCRGHLNRRTPANAQEVCEQLFGRYLYRTLGLQHHMDRFYGVPATQIDPLFVERRMQFLVQAASLKGFGDRILRAFKATLRKPDKRSKPRALVRPFGGFSELYQPARAQLERGGAIFILGAEIASIARDRADFVVTGSFGREHFNQIVNTIPLDMIWPVIGKTEELPIKYSPLQTLFISHAGPIGFSAPILYNFHDSGRWKRLTMHSEAYGLVDGRCYFSVEFPNCPLAKGNPEDLFEAFATSVKELGLFRGDLTLHGHFLTDKAYPVYTIGVQGVLDAMFRELDELGIITAGRQGRFDYLPTSNLVAAAVLSKVGAQS
ncbi:NAD(P)-binding protein [Sinorhizobium fredii]|nr:NAD(P)-binding protein [Sinorhizobium fredii]